MFFLASTAIGAEGEGIIYERSRRIGGHKKSSRAKRFPMVSGSGEDFDRRRSMVPPLAKRIRGPAGTINSYLMARQPR